jgi:predicted glycosyltransferase
VVCGSPRVFDVVQQYELSVTVQSKLHYCGYIVREPPTPSRDEVRREYGLAPSGRLVVVAVGGGSVGYPVHEAGLEAVRELRSECPDLEAVLVTGPLAAAEQTAALQSRAEAGVRVLRQADNFRLLMAADAVVSMSGYNSVAEALVAECPMLLSPMPPTGSSLMEQVLRAEALARLGVARVVPYEMLSSAAVANGMRQTLQVDRALHARRVREAGISFDGANWLARHVAPRLGRE